MIVARVRRTIRERALIEPGTRVLAACSGGPDSCAMLLALARLSTELGFELEAASVDHGLRPTAGADVDVARAQATAAGVPFHALQVQVAASSSLQAAARAARYRVLAELAERIGAQRTAVGHTQDDQAETVVLRLLRGAPVAGLAAIEPLRRDGVIRPLIDCRRADAAAFATQHAEQIARDASNDEPRFSRVRLRSDVLPVLEREDPAVIQHLADLADDARALTAALLPQVQALLQKSTQDRESIDVSSWDTEPDAVRKWALRQWIERATGVAPGRAQLAEAERATFAPAEVWLPDGWLLTSAGHGRLRILRSEGTSQPSMSRRRG